MLSTLSLILIILVSYLLYNVTSIYLDKRRAKRKKEMDLNIIISLLNCSIEEANKVYRRIESAAEKVRNQIDYDDERLRTHGKAPIIDYSTLTIPVSEENNMESIYTYKYKVECIMPNGFRRELNVIGYKEWTRDNIGVNMPVDDYILI